MSSLDCDISGFNTPRTKVPMRVNTFSCLASPIKTRSKSGPNFTPFTLSTTKKLQQSKLNLLKFNHSKTRTTSQTCPCENNLSSSSENNNSWICCSQCHQWWHSSCAQVLFKDLVKYSKYHIHYSCLFCVVKEVSSNKNINSKLNTIIPTSNVNINKAGHTEQGTNKAVNKVSKSTNLTLSRTTVSKNISHSEQMQESNKILKSLQTSLNELSFSDSQTVNSAESASNSQTKNKKNNNNNMTTTSNFCRVIFDNITISTIKILVGMKRYIYKYTDNQIHIKYTYRILKVSICVEVKSEEQKQLLTSKANITFPDCIAKTPSSRFEFLIIIKNFNSLISTEV